MPDLTRHQPDTTDPIERFARWVARLDQPDPEPGEEAARRTISLDHVIAAARDALAQAPQPGARAALAAIREARTHTCERHCTEGGCDFDLGAFVDRVDEILDNPHAPTAGLGFPADRAQGIRPADWEQQATDTAQAALAEAWHWLANDPAAARRLATAAVRAIIDAGLAGAGGRCRKCGATFPRTLPAGQDPLCWTCDSEEQTGLDEPADRAQDDGNAGYEVVARSLHRDGLGALRTGKVVASAVSTRPTLAEAVAELLHAIRPAEREG